MSTISAMATTPAASKALIDANFTALNTDKIEDAYTDLTAKSKIGTGAAQVAAGNHNHDATYAPLVHNHDSAYAPLVHDHDADYAAISHNHDADYADIAHNHDADYADIAHNHDATYAPLVHNHDGSYAPATPSINNQTGTTYSLVAGDNGKLVTFNNSGAITLTVPSGLGAGFSCLVLQLGTGQVTLSASSTTIMQRQSYTKTAGQGAVISLIAYAANSFVASGDMAS